MGRRRRSDGDQDRDLLIQWPQDLARPGHDIRPPGPEGFPVLHRQVAGFLLKRRNLTTKWTVHYRRINKKGISAEEAAKRRSKKKSTAVRRDISGLPMELLQKAKAARPKTNSTAKDAALKELKGRKGAKKK